MAAKFLQANGNVAYMAQARAPEDIKRDLAASGVDVTSAQKEGRLDVSDQYSATLTGGRLEPAGAQTGFIEKVQGGMRFRSLKVADLSVEMLKASKEDYTGHLDRLGRSPVLLDIIESMSEMLRFNEEKPFAEWMATRVTPRERMRKGATLHGLVRGLHSEWFYKRMEVISDGIIDISIREQEGESKSFLRLRSLRGQPYDGRWHRIEIQPNGEATLAT
jgi:KaiC/GvpD/RAD55 family RecA-like ATPase